MRSLKFLFTLLVLTSCTRESSTDLRALVLDYYDSYSKKDLEKWISFYDDKSVIHDITTGVVMSSKDSILNLVTPVFKGQIALYENIEWKIDEIIVEGNKASIKGNVSNAVYNCKVLPAWDFVSLITFNELGKISIQYDFVNYPDL